MAKPLTISDAYAYGLTIIGDRLKATNGRIYQTECGIDVAAFDLTDISTGEAYGTLDVWYELGQLYGEY